MGDMDGVDHDTMPWGCDRWSVCDGAVCLSLRSNDDWCVAVFVLRVDLFIIVSLGIESFASTGNATNNLCRATFGDGCAFYATSSWPSPTMDGNGCSSDASVTDRTARLDDPISITAHHWDG